MVSLLIALLLVLISSPGYSHQDSKKTLVNAKQHAIDLIRPPSLDNINLSPSLNDQATSLKRENPWFIRVGYQPGWVIPTSNFIRGINANHKPIRSMQSLKFEVGLQTDGTQDWHHDYNFPSYGIGFYTADFSNKEELGSPVGTYGFLSLPLLRLSESVDLTTDFGIGVAFGFKPFDPETNRFNRATGSSITAYLDWGLYLNYLLSTKLDVAGGLSFTHFSNGRTREPNIGLNTLAPRMSLRYNFHQERKTLLRRNLTEFKPSWELLFAVSGGSKNISALTDNIELQQVDRRQIFGVANFSTGIQRHFYRKGKLGGGIDVSYDGSANARIDLTADRHVVKSRGSAVERLNFGLFGGYEHIFHRFLLTTQLGYYVQRGRNDDRVQDLYQRFGFKFNLSENIFAGINVRFIDFNRADYIEWTTGYRFKWF